MKVFMNNKGQYLKWRTEPTRANPVLTYEWVADINQASAGLFIPNNNQPKWKHSDNPASQVVVSLEVSVVETRTVTILGEQDAS